MNDSRRTRVLLALLLVTSVSLITIDYRGAASSPLDGVRSVAASVFGPVERLAAAAAAPVGSALDTVRGLGDRPAEVSRLARANRALRARLRTRELDRATAEALTDLLGVAAAGRYRVVPARVLAIGPAQGFSWTVTLDVGSRDGVRPDLTVLNGDGLVGRVTTVGRNTATVLLALDPRSSVGVRLAGSREVGVSTGRGAGAELTLRLLDAQASVGPGDRLVTFGSQRGTPYVPGVPVGRVVSVGGAPGSQTRTALVRAYVDFTALDVVGVAVAPPRTDPRDAVLPPRRGPTPTPTVTVTVTASPAPPGGR